MAELLFWPALLLYGEAAVGYFGDVRRPGRAGRAATWGVRLGWLAQTALLAVQATRDDGFPWGTWASSLSLFVWLVVSAYLIWGCKPRYRLVGLAVMPVAVGLLVLAWAGGGTGVEESDGDGWALAVHAALMLAYYLRLRRAAPPPDFYNGLQRLAYSAIMVIALAEVLSGLAIYKPVQLWWLGRLFGGYDSARAVHLCGLGLFALFTLVHLVLVALHPRAILTMLTGGKRA